MVLVAVLSALTVASRVVFFMVPQFKPMAAMIIISAVCFGRETGFLVGTVSLLASNFFFGQGPWTPWQMLAFGLIGYVAGAFFCRKNKNGKKISKPGLCVFGFFAVMIIYGGILNPASLLMYSNEITPGAVWAAYVSGFPLDLLHAGCTVLFLWILSDTMREKLERVKKKYGLLKPVS